MKINIYDVPPTLHFGVTHDDAFGLRLKRFGSVERMAVLTACGRADMAEVQHAINRLVLGWEGVCDESGQSIPFEREDEKGRKLNNLDAFLGALPLITQVEVMGGILGLLQLPTDVIDGLRQSLMEAGVHADPTPASSAASGSPSSTPETASTD